ncbi:uncharacterized protein LOC133330362 [Musca vetustissima]|uniref:uncharacterized protein LOC133330362 n=1 Tax=Musca vetustissima TaxID=27455 RepID=UPI002AB7AD51|nr:uncharacterized protein LOC133330362 [Musca vetustissima]
MGSTAFLRFLRGTGCTGCDGIVSNFDVNSLNSSFVSNNLATRDLDFRYFGESDNAFSFSCVGIDDVAIALNNIKSKSIGIDGIPVDFIKHIFPYISNMILDLINTILTSSLYPTLWKKARGVPIPKAHIVNGPEDLRPISILPVLSKMTFTSSSMIISFLLMILSVM